MGKIIKVTDAEITIFTEEEYLKVPHAELDFVPTVGDKVEVHKLENEIIITKVETKTKLEDRININIVNENNSTQTQEQAQTQKQSQSQAQNLNTAPYYPGYLVNKWVYVFLAIFFGTVGAHHFYAGYNSRGLKYLVFFWTYIPGILGIVQGIGAILKTPDANGKILV